MAGPKKGPDGLTDRQRAYAAARAAGISQKKAYEAAGYSMNQNDLSKRTNACRLEKEKAVAEHIEYLKRLAAAGMLEDIKERKAALIELYLNSTNEKTKLKAIDLLNRMAGDYIDKKEISATVQGLTRSDRLDAMQDTLNTLKKAWTDSDV